MKSFELVTFLIWNLSVKIANRKSSKTRYSSYRRQNSSNDLENKPKERGVSAHARPQSAKDSSKHLSNKYSNNIVYGANWDYKDPGEFHKLRYSLAQNGDKQRRPSSAKRKDDNPLKMIQKDLKTPPEYTAASQLKSYNLEKNSFLDKVDPKEGIARSTRNSDNRYNTYELSKNKIYESRKSKERNESRKRSSSKDRVNESPKSKYTRNYGHKSNRSRSNKHGSRSNRSSDKHDDKHLAKTKSSSTIGHSSKISHHNTASLKFNNILKDMGAHCGVSQSTQFFNYKGKS